MLLDGVHGAPQGSVLSRHISLHQYQTNHALRYYAKEIDPCTCFILNIGIPISFWSMSLLIWGWYYMCQNHVVIQD